MAIHWARKVVRKSGRKVWENQEYISSHLIFLLLFCKQNFSLSPPQMEEIPSADMEIGATKMFRRSIFIFLKYYQYFTTIPVLLMLPFSVFVLLLQAFSSSSSCVISLLLTLSSIVMAKGCIIQALNQQKMILPPSFSSLISLYKSLFLTQICNSVIIVTANIVAFSVLFIGINSLESFGFSPKNPLILFVSRSVSSSFLAYTMVICNFSLVVTETENCSGFLAVFKACNFLRRVGKSRALLMSLPANLGAAAIGELFRYRIVGRSDCISMASEGLLIAYLHSLLIVLDTILSCLFFMSCKSNFPMNQTGGSHNQIEFFKEEDEDSLSARREIP